MTSTHLEPSPIELSSQEMLEISQEINQKFAPNPTLDQLQSVCPALPCNGSAFWQEDAPETNPAFQSQHNATVALLAEEILEISQTISKEFAPTVFLPNRTELALLPVDPFHVYAYWNLNKTNPPSPSSQPAIVEENIAEPLVLRVYWRADENTDITNAKLWFDLPVEGVQPRQKVQLPIDGTAYSAVIGRLCSDNSLTVLTHSNIVQVPAENTKTKSVFFAGQDSAIDQANRPPQINVFNPEKFISSTTLAYYNDPALIGWKYQTNGQEKTFAVKNTPPAKLFTHSYWFNQTASGQGK